MSPVKGTAFVPVAVCARPVSVLWKTTDWPTQVVTETGVAAAAELQLTVIGSEFTVSCAMPVLPAIVAWIATGPPTAAPRASPFESTVAMDPVATLHVGAGAEATTFPRASRAVPANCCVVQRGIDAVAGTTDTLATTCWTVTGSPGAALA